MGLPQAGTPASTDVGVSIPKEYTPVYDCVVVYFQNIAHGHLLRGHFHRVLDQLGIPHSSPLKDVLITATVQIDELHSQKLDLKGYEPTSAAWSEAQYKFLEEQANATKRIYDNLLDAVHEEGLDSDNVEKTIVEEGRKVTGVAVLGAEEIDERQQEILRIFEPDTKNPWLKKEED